MFKGCSQFHQDVLEHEHVELAVDTNGCMHVLANAEDLRDANIVCAWANKHRGLIAMACGGLQVDEGVSSVQHLFTNDAVCSCRFARH